MWVENGKPFRSPHPRQQVTRSHIPIPQKGPTGPKKEIKTRFWGNSNKNALYTYCDCHPPVILERTHSKKASSKEIFVRPNGQRSCYENKPVRIAIGERGKEDECGEVEVGGCVSPHPRQRGRWCFDWSHNTRVKTQPVCPVLLCSAPQARNSTAPGKNYPQHFQACASESRSWPHSIIVYMYKIHCILLSPVWSRYWL